MDRGGPDKPVVRAPRHPGPRGKPGHVMARQSPKSAATGSVVGRNSFVRRTKYLVPVDHDLLGGRGGSRPGRCAVRLTPVPAYFSAEGAAPERARAIAKSTRG